MTTAETRLTIGQLAARFDLNTSAIRYYERQGVLPPPERVSGQRRYGPDAIRRLEVLEIAKRGGFTLDEARLLLDQAAADSLAFEAIRDLAERKLPEIDALIRRAQAMRGWLTTATDCSCASLDVCALFTASTELQHNPITVTQVAGSAHRSA
ncbi:MerR family transcriptional regulator [Paraconexibacter sp. AEG42_29]|uniref:MerR family transcriptional regulator n=1 Tax=Paraconexibacter sp. AEG42_29 TaxID=2997339 RepID=UPI00339D477C